VKKEKKGKDNNNKIEVKVELIKEEELLLKELATGLYNSFKDECIFMAKLLLIILKFNFLKKMKI